MKPSAEIPAANTENTERKPMLRSLPVNEKLKEYEEVHRLYDASFPDDERIPWHRLLKKNDESRQMRAWFDNDQLVGLSYVFVHGNIAYLGYLAIEENLREKGYGSMVLKEICSAFEEYKVVIDIEIVTEEADNYEERLRRREFYMRCGFERTGVGYYFWYVDYELLSIHGIVTEAEFRDLIIAHWGPFAKRAVFKRIEV